MEAKDTTDQRADPAAQKRAVQERKARALEMDSPEGRPPSKGARRLSWVIFWIAGAALLIALIVGVALTRSTAAVVIAGALIILYALATMPVWGAMLLRKEEKERVERRVQESEVISR